MFSAREAASVARATREGSHPPLKFPRDWVEAELAPWRGLRLTAAALDRALDEATARHGQMFRYDIARGKVRLRTKTPVEIGPGVRNAIVEEVEARAEAYAGLIQSALPLAGLTRPLSLAIEVSDIPPECPGLPFFAFQRQRGEPTLLLPDVDLMHYGYLDRPPWTDRTAFKAKRNQAIFVGSTTGERLTLEKVQALSPPRLRAAAFFKNSRNVVFQLPNVVQCDSAETEAAVKALGFGDRMAPWPEQMLYRHLISMDGNGATCSRVAVALNSNSTLLKYDSPYELFYFRALEPWRHYVPIASDADVEQVVEDSARNPDRYAKIAREGARFARRRLRRGPCRRYVAALLRGYAALVD